MSSVCLSVVYICEDKNLSSFYCLLLPLGVADVSQVLSDCRVSGGPFLGALERRKGKKLAKKLGAFGPLTHIATERIGCKCRG